MTRSTYLFSGVCAAALWSGCNDLGDCTDPAQGRVPVKLQTQVMYAGQAIMQGACSAGSCHTESTSRELRYGAPAGLDFDLLPAEATPDADGGIAQVDPEALHRLRKHQRKVFDERHSIWEQVERGLMPPGGKGQPFRDKALGDFIDVSGGGCPEVAKLAPITDKQTQETLRNWLACGAPIIEANVPNLMKPVGGTVGDQFPACESLAPTFDNLYSSVLSGCVTGCHEPGDNAGAEVFDLSTPQIAYASLMGSGTGMVPSNCSRNDNFMVTPGKPDESYIVAKVGGGGTLCKNLMPLGSDGLDAAGLSLLKGWIEAGAPGPGAGAGNGSGDKDAGVSSGMDGGT